MLKCIQALTFLCFQSLFLENSSNILILWRAGIHVHSARVHVECWQSNLAPHSCALSARPAWRKMLDKTGQFEPELGMWRGSNHRAEREDTEYAIYDPANLKNY